MINATKESNSFPDESFPTEELIFTGKSLSSVGTLVGGGWREVYCRWRSCAAGSCYGRRERSYSLEKLNGWGWRGGSTGLARHSCQSQITIEIHISDWTHKFQNKTGLDAKANSELYKSNRVNSAYKSLHGRRGPLDERNVLSFQINQFPCFEIHIKFSVHKFCIELTERTKSTWHPSLKKHEGRFITSTQLPRNLWTG